ncbi:EAL domain-containing protein [Paenibacillus sp. y28]|uniref:EAL domain-containing protein n=1 Tax=Paenibacillus sp. y28 TaxID=3129110 RepID=UPI003019EF84
MDYHVHGTYNQFLVFLSYLIAVTASYSALDLAGRISTAKGKSRVVWLVCGAVAMGLGIWSMHFVGMLALALPVQVAYDVPLFLLSVVLAILVSCVALFTVGRNKLGLRELLISGLLMAAGICGMHYIGMAAMLIEITYNGWLVGLSICIAATASVVALWLLFYFRKAKSKYAFLYKLGSALIMGAAIAGMHYTGMMAAQFHPGQHPRYDSGMQIQSEMIAYIIVLSTFMLLGLTLLGIFVNKRLLHKDLVILENERWYRSLYRNNGDGIISIDIQGRIMSMNPAILSITGLKAEAYLNKHISELVTSFPDEDEERARSFYCQSFKEQGTTCETSIQHADGRRTELLVMNVPVEIEGVLVGNHLIVRDITAEKQAKDKIKHLAYHDELTGLPNRRMFNELLLQYIEEGESQGGSFGVMVLDIDRFKMINDSLGHTYGDLFLQMVSDRISTGIADHEATLARMGGDEFTLICRTTQDGAEAEIDALAKQIIHSLQQPFYLKDNDFYISASIGTALFPQHGTSSVELLKKADAAMYEVKKKGKNGHQFYSPMLDDQLLEKIELEAELRKAIDRNELIVYYQPQIHTRDNLMIGVEALVRWQHPTKGIISPGLFIPIAEETGLIIEIGTWVLREACRQMREWHLAGGPLIPVSVNLSSQQFHQPHLVDYIQAILKETDLAPQFLELEITESMMMDAKISTGILKELSEIGIRISLDDFGTGYSSLSYLKTFPIHKLKIDRSFITDISLNENDQAIVATIISMAQHLNLDVVAEGIETKAQLDILTEKECREIQGYYFSQPLSAEDVEKQFFLPQRAV